MVVGMYMASDISNPFLDPFQPLLLDSIISAKNLEKFSLYLFCSIFSLKRHDLGGCCEACFAYFNSQNVLGVPLGKVLESRTKV